MSKVEEIEQMIEQLPEENVKELAEWISRRFQPRPEIRDHSAFLNSFVPGDEGLYDDAVTR